YPMHVKAVIYDTSSSIHLRGRIIPQLQLYPNPTKDKVYIKLSGPNKKQTGISIRLFDYTGRLLQQKDVNAGKGVIDLSRYTSVIYCICFWYADKDIGGGKGIWQ